ncbi:hypothetical protein LTS06_012420 [Exophiala xenobiotica]|nr:hypothetical protein LTS06_012420 [Exophiala xenobiotica]
MEPEGGDAGGALVTMFVLLEAGPATREEKLSVESAIGDEIDMDEFVAMLSRAEEPATGPVVVGVCTLLELT